MNASDLFFGEQDQSRHGGQLLYPGGPDGYPLRIQGNTPVPLLRQEEYESLPTRYDFRHRLFDTECEEDMKEYATVMDRVYNGGWFILITRERHWIAEERKYLIYLEWLQAYTELPKGERRARLS